MISDPSIIRRWRTRAAFALLLLAGGGSAHAQSSDPFANAPPPAASPASRPARIVSRPAPRMPPPRENPFPVTAKALVQLGLLSGKP